MVSENILSAIWDTFHLEFFGQIWTQDSLRHISYDILWSLSKYVNFGNSRAVWNFAKNRCL